MKSFDLFESEYSAPGSPPNPKKKITVKKKKEKKWTKAMTIKLFFISVLWIQLACVVASLNAALILPSIFGDHMALQRGQQNPVVNLHDRNSLPVTPFRADDWKVGTIILEDPQSWTSLNVSLIALVHVVVNGSGCLWQSMPL